MSSEGSTGTESVEVFRQRAREWIAASLRPSGEYAAQSLHSRPREEELAAVGYDRALQRRFFDAGLAGVAIPADCGGLGLTPAHQYALNEELSGYEWPSRFTVPTMAPCGAVLLEFAPEEFKRQHLAAILRGEEIWMQFLSEPSGGSDMAAALTTAVRDGEEWVLNGSKIWTTGAWWADWALCLARTNWDVPKHHGLTMFAVPIHQPGIEVRQIEMLNGARDFCQEYLTDVRVPDAHRIGEVGQGWAVATRLLFHERMQHNSPYVTRPLVARRGLAAASKARIADASGLLDDTRARDLIGEGRVLNLAGAALQRRVASGMHSGRLPENSSAIARLFDAEMKVRETEIEFDLAGGLGAAWDDDGAAAGIGDAFLMRQTAAIGGGTSEMARNVIAERVLGMPREQTLDRGVPFRDVPRGASR